MSPYLIYPAAAAGLSVLAGAFFVDKNDSNEIKTKAFVVTPIVTGVAVAAFIAINAAYGLMIACAIAGLVAGITFVRMNGENDPKIIALAAVVGCFIGAYSGAFGVLAAKGQVGLVL